jgi:hypothetical protein
VLSGEIAATLGDTLVAASRATVGSPRPHQAGPRGLARAGLLGRRHESAADVEFFGPFC